MEAQALVLDAADFQVLLDALRDRGYQVIGPRLRDGAVVYDSLDSVDEMPIGWGDLQEAGRYQLQQRGDRAFFGYSLSPQSWKRFLHPPQLRLWQARRSGQSFEIDEESYDAPPYAFIGVRACELAAIAVQDRVFLQGAYVDRAYQQRRDGVFMVAVHCGQAGNTCFCASLGTGPQVETGYDLALTEILTEQAHYFVVEIGSQRGLQVAEALPCREATETDLAQARQIVEQTASQMGRSLDTSGLKETLYSSDDNPLWDEIAQRCLTCGNCTMVCPTCFCTTVEDITDLSGETAERQRLWDSCFTLDFSYIHGGSVRYSPKARYRQWLTHKMASWIDQFGELGCIGCGRCITWCPVGIDITAEAEAIRQAERQKEASA